MIINMNIVLHKELVLKLYSTTDKLKSYKGCNIDTFLWSSQQCWKIIKNVTWNITDITLF